MLLVGADSVRYITDPSMKSVNSNARAPMPTMVLCLSLLQKTAGYFDMDCESVGMIWS